VRSHDPRHVNPLVHWLCAVGRDMGDSVSAHTPGPWYWHTDSRGQVSLRTPDRGNLIVMDCARKGMQGAAPRFAIWPHMEEGVERGRLGGILVDFDSDHPDAHLIVSAPDLYLALAECLADMEHSKDAPLPPEHPTCVAKAMARRALAKARGKS
jgi:hypothetical protein